MTFSAARVTVNFTDLMQHPRAFTTQDAPGSDPQLQPMPMDRPGAAKIRARQIRTTDLPAVAELLARGFGTRPRRFWLRLLACLTGRTAPAGLPKYGYLLEGDGAVVGAILLIFSTLDRGGADVIRCNVSSWYVEEAFRSYASLLVSKALSHRNVTYLNITPAPHTLPLVEAQGYSQYSKGIVVAAPALQLRSAGDARVVAAAAHTPAPAERFEHELLLEYAEYGCLSLWCETAAGAYPFVFRPRLVKGVIACAQLVYCRDVDDFVRFAGPIGRFLARRGRALVLIDANGPIPGLIGRYFDATMPKYFKGPDRPRLGDLAHTEAAMFGI
jgi:hypothetical protein